MQKNINDLINNFYIDCDFDMCQNDHILNRWDETKHITKINSICFFLLFMPAVFEIINVSLPIVE